MYISGKVVLFFLLYLSSLLGDKDYIDLRVLKRAYDELKLAFKDKSYVILDSFYKVMNEINELVSSLVDGDKIKVEKPDEIKTTFKRIGEDVANKKYFNQLYIATYDYEVLNILGLFKAYPEVGNYFTINEEIVYLYMGIANLESANINVDMVLNNLRWKTKELFAKVNSADEVTLAKIYATIVYRDYYVFKDNECSFDSYPWPIILFSQDKNKLNFLFYSFLTEIVFYKMRNLKYGASMVSYISDDFLGALFEEEENSDDEDILDEDEEIDDIDDFDIDEDESKKYIEEQADIDLETLYDLDVDKIFASYFLKYLNDYIKQCPDEAVRQKLILRKYLLSYAFYFENPEDILNIKTGDFRNISFDRDSLFYFYKYIDRTIDSIMAYSDEEILSNSQLFEQLIINILFIKTFVKITGDYTYKEIISKLQINSGKHEILNDLVNSLLLQDNNDLNRL